MTKSELNDALPILSQIDYTDVPKDNLEKYMKDVFKSAEIIINSIPNPPASGSPPSPPSAPNTAKKPEDTVCSPFSDNEIDARHADIQSAWGKPVKNPAKDNPLNITVYKMSGNDKHGAWFARRSTHQNLGFTRWKKMMQKEFATSLAQTGGPGTGAVRGIAADKRLEKNDVEGVGKLEVYQLSAIFGPITAREFVSLIHTSDNALSEASAVKATNKPPRHYLVVSRPTSHPEAPARDNHVMGAYESIEMIRELPIAKEGADPETNPVEWIMITRSDPGGGVPRFMVERGTPGSVVEDTSKFLKWALSQPEPSDDDVQAQEKKDEVAAEKAKLQPEQQAAVVAPPPQAQSTTQNAHVDGNQDGILGTIAGYTEAAVASYAPSYLPTVQHALGTDAQEDEDDDDSDSSSEGYVSAEDDLDSRPTADTIARDRTATMSSTASGVSESQRSLAAELESGTATPTNHNEKNVVKLSQKRSELDEKHAKINAEHERKLKDLVDKDPGSASKDQQKIEKEKQKQQAKYQKELEKLEKKQKKEAAKAEEKRAKALSKDELKQARTERDELKTKLGIAEKENESLKQQIADLQRRLGTGASSQGVSGVGAEGEEHQRHRAATMPVHDNHVPGTTRYI